MRNLKGLICRLYPRRLRNQMIMMAILMVIVPTISIGYIVETEGRSAVLSEKEKKLSSVVTLLNDELGDRFSHFDNLPREARIRALNEELSCITTKRWMRLSPMHPLRFIKAMLVSPSRQTIPDMR